MNAIQISDKALEGALAAKLREILAGVGWLRGWKVEQGVRAGNRDFDLLATLPLPHGAKATLWVECKKEMRPSVFPRIADKFVPSSSRHKSVVPVLAVPFMSPRVAELCHERGWSWFDLAGNCRLDVPGWLHLQRTGQAPVHRQPRPLANLGTAETGRVIRALLAPENAGKRWTQRLLAGHFSALVTPIRKPSLGLINKVVRYLRDEAFIDELADGGFRLRDPLKLLFTWRDAYHFGRHERRRYFTLFEGTRRQEALATFGTLSGGFAAYASFSAADFQAPHVRQPKTWLFVRGQELEEFEEVMEAKQVESGENLIVMIPDDEGVFYLADRGRAGQRSMGCTNLVQTYVDLSHSGGRGKEAAEALLEQRLKPAWKSRGMI